MRKCKYCNEPFILNENIDKLDLPTKFKEKIKYIPNCNCIEKNTEIEIQESIKKQELESMQNNVKRYADISIMDTKLKSCSFQTISFSRDKKIKEDKHFRIAENYCKMFLKNETENRGIIFSGGVGTGKTTASACIANELMKNGKTVLVMNINKYLIKLKKEWAEAEADVLKKAAKCDLLILDDMGTEKISEFVLEKTFNLIDARYRVSKPLIITTNLAYNEDAKCDLGTKFAMDGHERIKDRIKEICVPVVCSGKSRRNSNKRNFFEKLMEV